MEKCIQLPQQQVKNVYLAGAMTGQPYFNFPKFFEEATKLRQQGYVVFSPAEADLQRYGAFWKDCPNGTKEEVNQFFGINAAFTGFGIPDYRDCMSIDLNWILDNADAIALIPGWEKSKGVKAELALAECLDLEVINLLSEKPSNPNPKDALGIKKVSISCVPQPTLYGLALAMMEGARKYGKHNYRVIGVRASIYYDACKRHLDSWWEGQDIDPDSGLPHIWKAMACLTILDDARQLGKLTDDRPPPHSENWQQELNEMTIKLIEKYPDCKEAYVRSN